MSNEHIGRKQSIGIGVESAAGTAVAASAWIPKIDGEFTPTNTSADDTGAYGVIDELKDQQTVKTITSIDFSAILRDGYAGYLFKALFGNAYSSVRIPIPGSITGTYTIGETITETTSSATGTLRRMDVLGSSKVLFIVPASGTFTGGQTLTGGSSGATATGGTIESPSAVRTHVFPLANTNTHTTFTMYGSDPVGDFRATYCMMDNFDIEITSGDYAKFQTTFMGKKLASTSTQTPSFSNQNGFLTKFATFSAASAYSGLDAASATAIKSAKISIKKNLTDYQTWGSTDVAGFFNRQFSVSGEFTLLYNATTFRDYMLASTKQAFRVKLANTDVTIGSGSNPTIQLDIPSCSFKEFKRTTSNNDIVEQTLLFKSEYDVTTAMTINCLLTNSTTASY